MEKFKVPEQTFEPIGEQFTFVLHEQEKSRGGVVLPETSRGRIEQGQAVADAPLGTVVAAGCQCRYVRRGDLVILMGSVTPFQHGNQKLWRGLEGVNVLGIVSDHDGLSTRHVVTDWREHVIERLQKAEGIKEQNDVD